MLWCTVALVPVAGRRSPVARSRVHNVCEVMLRTTLCTFAYPLRRRRVQESVSPVDFLYVMMTASTICECGRAVKAFD